MLSPALSFSPLPGPPCSASFEFHIHTDFWLLGRTILLSLHPWPRLLVDLEYPVYGAHELADEGAFTSLVVLSASFPSGFC